MAILPHTFTVPGGQALTIYGETANINYFIRGDLEPDTVDGPVNVQVDRSGGSRRQYPGDSSRIGFSASSAEYVKDPTRSSGPALPGKNFILDEKETNEGNEKRQFTYVGRFIDLHTFISAEAAMPLYLRNHTGARYTIEQSAAPTP